MVNEETKERRCIYCKKILIHEKVPFCRRCRLEGRNTAKRLGGISVGLITFALSANALASDRKTDDDTD